MCKIIFTCFLLTIWFANAIHAQPSPPLGQPQVGNAVRERGSDTAKVHRHPPNTAMIFSTLVPGLGQAYNKKYWKIPIIYAAMGTTVYFFNSNNKLYKQYKQAYINKTDGKDSTVDAYPSYSETQLSELENYYHKYRDLNVILAALCYTLNIVDAYVDAQLFRFDVSDDLSMQVLPSINFSAAARKPSAGLTLALTF